MTIIVILQNNLCVYRRANEPNVGSLGAQFDIVRSGDESTSASKQTNGRTTQMTVNRDKEPDRQRTILVRQSALRPAADPRCFLSVVM